MLPHAPGRASLGGPPGRAPLARLRVDGHACASCPQPAYCIISPAGRKTIHPTFFAAAGSKKDLEKDEDVFHEIS
jgi:hypothetical protein